MRLNAKERRARGADLDGRSRFVGVSGLPPVDTSRSSAHYEAVEDLHRKEWAEFQWLGGKHSLSCGFERLYALPTRKKRFGNLSRRVGKRLYGEGDIDSEVRREAFDLERVPATAPADANVVWEIDFMMVAVEVCHCRILVVSDVYTRECLALGVDYSPRGERVVRVLDRTPRSAAVRRL